MGWVVRLGSLPGRRVVCGRRGRVGVVGWSLPWHPWLTEVDTGAGCALDLLVQGELAALIPCQREPQVRRDLEQSGGGGGARPRCGVAVWEVQQHDVAADPFDERPDRGAHVGTDDEITLPMTDRATLQNLCGSLVDELHVGDLVLGRDTATLRLASLPTCAQLGGKRAKNPGEQRPRNHLRAGPHRRIMRENALQEPRDLRW